MSEGLKPCPLCGRSIQLYYKLRESDHPYDDDLLEAWPSCHCPLSLKESAGYGEEEKQKEAKIELIGHWNVLPRYPRPLRWTKELPKKPGWYWLRCFEQSASIINVACDLTEYEAKPYIEWAGPIPEPKEQANTAAHIAANSPDVVMADIDEILRLRADVERLEKEANWLATRLANALIDPILIDDLQALSNGLPHPPTPEMLRETARKAVGKVK